MTDEKRQKLKDIFDAALRQKSGQREQFVNQECAGDETLRAEINSLLFSFDSFEDFMQGTAIDEVAEIILEKNSLEKGRSFGHYEIIEHIGTGGMGEVYLARDKKLDRRVALKILTEKFLQHEINRSRFIQEARAASGLNHPNILVIHEIDETDSIYYIVSEYIEGKTLRHLIEKSSIKLGEVLAISVQIANALSAAHGARIIHRDIKPENIMVRPDGLVKILDFGLAKLVEQQNKSLIDLEYAPANQNETARGMIVGTPHYMSPEQAKGERVDERTDIFSLGVVIYEMLTGRTPFGCESVSETWTKLLHTEPEPLARYLSEAPDELQKIVSKMLEKNRDERYQTTGSLLDDLKSLKTISRNQAIPATSGANFVTGKNSRRPRNLLALLSILLLAALGLGYWFYANRSSPAETSKIDSIVVLPFQNRSGNSDAEYLSDGLAESLINSLTELRQLRVIARTTAFRYRDREIDPQVVGRELNVRAVLMGRVRQIEDRLSIQVDLVDAVSGAQIWGNEYERKLSDMLSVKQDIAREVTEKLRLKLSGEERQQLARRETASVEAYKFYLKGRFYWNKRTIADIKKAIEEFQMAVISDPNYGLGYVGLADCYVLLQEYTENTTAEAELVKARVAVDRALKIDDTLAEAHASSAYIHLTEWHWTEAEKEFKRAIELNPNYPTTHHWFALYFMVKRQFDEALKEARRAQELDPVSPTISGNVALIYLLKNESEAAIEECRKIIEFEPDNVHFTREYLGLAYLKQGAYDKAAAEFEKAAALSNRGGRELSALGYLYAVTGKRAAAMAILKELEEKNAGRRAFWIYAGLGDKDQTFAALEKQFQQRSRGLRHITYNLFLDNLRSDPRYSDLVRRMGLAP